MGLTSSEFVLLFPIVAVIYYIIPYHLRKYGLFLVNLMFCISFGVSGVFVVALEAAILFAASFCVKKVNNDRIRKICSILCIGFLFIILALTRLLPRFSDEIIAPIGVSFYTLGAISYLIDMRRKEIEPETNFITLLTWISFFPSITAGPIYRFKTFREEYEINKHYLKPDYTKITNGIIYMIYGYFLKLVIAERAAIPVNYVFDKIGTQYFNSIVLVVIAITYSIQIYADFAGYSAIVIGIAQILGFYVPENFLAPYFSRSIKEFWGRWHISLSTWLRDYIYIPLGGNKKGIFRKYANIFITFLISALWHGTGTHFMVWGGLHASYQVIEGIVQGVIKRTQNEHDDNNKSVLNIINQIKTFICVTIAWIFFKTGVRDAILYLKEIFIATRIDKESMWMLGGMGIDWRDWHIIIISIMVVAFIDMLLYKKKKRLDEILSEQRFSIKAVSIIGLSLAVLMFGLYGDQHDASYFIYRDF